MRTINTTLVEEVYNETFEELKILLKENIFREVHKYVEEKSIEDFFVQLYTDEDVKEFIKQDTISLRVYTVTDEFLTSDYNINVHSVFYVDAKILGQ